MISKGLLVGCYSKHRFVCFSVAKVVFGIYRSFIRTNNMLVYIYNDLLSAFTITIRDISGGVALG